MATVRYIVQDVGASVEFYVDNLGFKLFQQFGPAMAIVTKGDLTLWFAGPQSSAGQAMANGKVPQPGGWSRIVIKVENLGLAVSKLQEKNVHFLNEITSGPGGSQILCEDPSRNVIELFQEK